MSKRINMVQKQLLRLLGEYFIKYGKDFDINFVSINDIVVSRDLGSAKVWVSFLGNANPEKTFQRLKKNTHAIQSYVYKHMQIKRVPKLEWIKIENLKEKYRLEQILDDIKSVSDQHTDPTENGSSGEEDSDSSSY